VCVCVCVCVTVCVHVCVCLPHTGPLGLVKVFLILAAHSCRVCCSGLSECWAMCWSACRRICYISNYVEHVFIFILRSYGKRRFL